MTVPMRNCERREAWFDDNDAVHVCRDRLWFCYITMETDFSISLICR